MSPVRARTSRLRHEEGWVMIPVIALLAITILLGFGLLLLVDRQTSAAQEKRNVDAAQALSDGVLNSTASVLASIDTGDAALMSAAWPTTSTTGQPCKIVTGDLNGPAPAAPPSESAEQKLVRLIQTRVLDGFDDIDNDYVAKAGRSTTWTVQICPDRTDGSPVWSEAYLGQPVATASNAARRTIWVRAQANVRPTASGNVMRSRASAAQVRQSSTRWSPPEDLAIGTASFSTDLGTGVTNLLKDGLVGKLVLQGLLGQGQLIEDGGAKIGLRCGLLDALDNPGLNLCVSGALGGVNSLVGAATDTLSLGAIGDALGGILGIDRTVNLSTYTIAPDKARAAFESLARSSGIYLESVPGGDSGTTASCLAGTSANPNGKFVYIKKVGTGDQYCQLPPNISPIALVIEQGRARVTSSFHGVLYAANRQEVDGATTPAEIEAKRQAAPLRETIRIEYPGSVTGAVWTDGAGGQVGIYPPGTVPTSNALINVGGPQGICSLPILGPLLQGLGSLLQGVLDTVGGLLGGLLGGDQYRTVYSNADGCTLLKNTLGNLTQSQLINLFGSGGQQTVVVKEKRHCNGLAVVLGGLALCNLSTASPPWGSWVPAQTNTFDIPSLLSNLSVPNVLSQLLGTLSATLLDWTAVDRNIDAIRLAGVPLAVGAGVVPGTYRNLVPRAADVSSG